MLDPKDVRVGNWVIKVTGRDANDKAFFEYLPIAIDEYYFTWARYCFPIPLTPALLEICGFRWEAGDWCKHVSLPDGKEQQLLVCRQNGGWHIQSFPIPFPPRYLHQLQNLYYALTGQELVIELTPYQNSGILLPVHHFYDPLKGAALPKAKK
jgi:hypothetical protein